MVPTPVDAAAPVARPLVDRYSRRIEYLRVSVTDRCNLRCRYCTPLGEMNYVPHSELLSFEEIVEIVSAMARRGLKKIRLTGGEPLVRKDIVQLVRMVRSVPGIEKVVMTTNGYFLPEMASPLRGAGLQGVNVSLDTMDPERFKEITRVGQVAKVWEGVEAALAAGLSTKINVVLMKGVNDVEIPNLVGLVFKHPVSVRFIELMRIGGHCGDPTFEKYYVPGQAVTDYLKTLGPLKEEGILSGEGPARYYTLPGAQAPVGLIAHNSNNFCERCNRVRLTATGELKLCLFGNAYVDLRAVVRRPGHGAADFDAALDHAMTIKPEKSEESYDFTMNAIGG